MRTQETLKISKARKKMHSQETIPRDFSDLGLRKICTLLHYICSS